MRKSLPAIILLLTAASWASGQALDPLLPFESSGPARPWLKTIRVVSSHVEVTPGQKFALAVDIDLQPGWTYYSPEPGPIVQPGSLSLEAGPFKLGQALWPPDQPHTSQQGAEKQTSFGYEGKVVIFQWLQAPADVKPGQYVVRVGPNGQACGTEGAASCVTLELPTPVQASVTVKVGSAAQASGQWEQVYAPRLAHAMTAEQLKMRHAASRSMEAMGIGGEELTVWAGLGLALLAGLILNIMPCVLPVIPLKVLSMVQMAGESRRRFVILGLAFAGGIMLFFLGLAVASTVLRVVTHQAFNWGEHFQAVSFRIAMAMLLVAIAANMFGLFTVTVPGKIANLAAGSIRHEPRYHGVPSAVGSGMLTAVLSTPCSFAILTVAIAWAQTQEPWLGAVAMLTIGAGMAMPYALLTAFPGLVNRLPKPGRWMELFKQSMGFVLLIVAIWLIGSVSDYSYPLWVVAYAAVLVFCLWAWGAWVQHDSPLRQKLTIRGLAVLIAVMAGVWMLQPPRPLATNFAPFDEAKIADARQHGRVVLVDFTANWCLTCKTVEAWVYDDKSVADELQRRNVLVMKGDITTSDLPANKMLFQGLKEPGVPVTVIFPPIPPDSPTAPPPIRLRGLFKRSDLINALNQAEKGP
jgi:thiol:disulfide interchange protein